VSRPQTHTSLAGLAAFTLLATAACGSSSSSTANNQSSSYVVGVVAALTGSEASADAGMVHAIELAADQANASGGVLGHKIVLQEQDEACNPPTAVNAANKLVELRVTAVVGSFCSGAALVMEPIYARANIPFVIAGADSPALVAGAYHNVAQSVGDFTSEVPSMNYLVTHILSLTKVGVADDQSAFGKGIADAMASGLQGAGVQVDRQSVSATQNDFSAVLQSFANSNDGAILWTGYYAQAVNLVLQLRQSGSRVPFIVTDAANVDSYIQGASSAANGTYATSSPATSFFKSAATFIADYQKKYGQAADTYSVLGYDGMNTLLQAVKHAGTTDPSKVIAALHQISFVGATGPISFDANGRRNIGVFPIEQVVNQTWALTPQQTPAIAQFLQTGS
jgi:branched-chain amino acid transport system substrate-binding protein